MIKLQCSKCGYIRKYFDEDIIKNEKCELCNSDMVLAKKELENVVEHDSILQMERQLKELGHSRVWEIIEQWPQVEIRLSYRKLFFQAGGIVPNTII